MRIYEVRISEEIAEKIQAQHGVLPEDAEEILFSQPVIRRARDGRYMAIGLANGYLTVIFEFEKGAAEIVTAYRRRIGRSSCTSAAKGIDADG
jgi:uncharacterized DUF497 family protein